MLKREIKYMNFNDEEVTETFYFNLTKPELLELEFSYKDGIDGLLKKMLADDDVGDLLDFFKKFILLSYGKKSPDGNRFIKDDELTREFTQTNAYAALYMELLESSDKASEFVNGVVPSDLAAQLNTEEMKQKIAKELGIEAPKTEEK